MDHAGFQKTKIGTHLTNDTPYLPTDPAPRPSNRPDKKKLNKKKETPPKTNHRTRNSRKTRAGDFLPVPVDRRTGESGGRCLEQVSRRGQPANNHILVAEKC